MKRSMTYPIPKNDKERIVSLHSYNILDSAREEIYDDISEMVAKRRKGNTFENIRSTFYDKTGSEIERFYPVVENVLGGMKTSMSVRGMKSIRVSALS